MVEFCGHLHALLLGPVVHSCGRGQQMYDWLCNGLTSGQRTSAESQVLRFSSKATKSYSALRSRQGIKLHILFIKTSHIIKRRHCWRKAWLRSRILSCIHLYTHKPWRPKVKNLPPIVASPVTLEASELQLLSDFLLLCWSVLIEQLWKGLFW